MTTADDAAASAGAAKRPAAVELEPHPEASTHSSKRPRQPQEAAAEGGADEGEGSISSAIKNDYQGFQFAAGAPREIETLDLDALYARHGGDEAQVAEAFFRQYVAPRKPVLIRGKLRDAAWLAGDRWADDGYLKARAGDAVVKVETREDAHARYGRGREVSMPLARFIDEVAKGSELLYLTTQELELGPDDRPAIMSSPVTELRGDFPLRPGLMGHLVPQNINLWMGRSAEGSSSGLHHDYHDNLYILLRGQKRFRLFSPADAHRMYTVGPLARVHANGRINYADQPPTHADGRELGADRAFEAARRLEEAAAAAFGGGAGRAAEEGKKGKAADADADAEAALDAALDAVLDAEMEGEDEDFDEDEDDEPEPEPDDEEEEEEEEEGEADAEAAAGDGEEGDAAPKEKPPPHNFSRVDLDAPGDRHEAFPAFPREPPAEATVRVGEMLYLPAGWFHEVTSSGGVHAAFNYWFHPPDALEDFARPYASPFWPRDWAERVAMERQEAAAAGGGK